MALLVFVGVCAVGNPVEMLIKPQADEAERLRATIALGLDKPLYVQFLSFLQGAIIGDLGTLVSYSASRPLELIPTKLLRDD